jgi:hypothetical protein
MGKWIHIYLFNYYFAWPFGEHFDGSERLSEDQWDRATGKYGSNVINKYNEPIGGARFKVPDVKVEDRQRVRGTVNVDMSGVTLTTEQIFKDYFQRLTMTRDFGPKSYWVPWQTSKGRWLSISSTESYPQRSWGM